MGMFEGGFFPGVVLYLTYWFPVARRAKVNGLFMTSFAIAGIVGGPIAGLIMSSLGGARPPSFACWKPAFQKLDCANLLPNANTAFLSVESARLHRVEGIASVRCK
jgi:MFS family permease